MKGFSCIGLAILALGALVPSCTSIYVDTGNPYEKGKLSVSNFFLPSSDGGLPKRTMVYHPTEPGEYAIVFFISGLGGFIPSFLYENHLANVSAHGYIVASSVFFVPGSADDLSSQLYQNISQKEMEKMFLREDDVSLGDRGDTYWKILIWLQENLQKELSKRAEGVVVSFDDLAYSCHSAGCREVYNLILRNISLPKAVTFLEPYAQILTPNDFYLPGMLMGTELGDVPPACSQPGRDFRQNYENWACPRVLSNVKNHGHCDILSPFGWKMCRLINFCTTTPDADLNRYHMFLQGYTSAFYGTYVQNNGDMLKYVIDPEMIPIEFIEFKTDVNC